MEIASRPNRRRKRIPARDSPFASAVSSAHSPDSPRIPDLVGFHPWKTGASHVENGAMENGARTIY
jgi:hypothetical protein